MTDAQPQQCATDKWDMRLWSIVFVCRFWLQLSSSAQRGTQNIAMILLCWCMQIQQAVAEKPHNWEVDWPLPSPACGRGTHAEVLTGGILACVLTLAYTCSWQICDGKYKKLSYRREIACQLPTWTGARPSSPLPLHPLWRNWNRKPATNVRQACWSLKHEVPHDCLSSSITGPGWHHCCGSTVSWRITGSWSCSRLSCCLLLCTGPVDYPQQYQTFTFLHENLFMDKMEKHFKSLAHLKFLKAFHSMK